MKQIIAGEDRNSRWSRRAGVELDSLRAERLIDGAGSVLDEGRDSVQWWTFAGFKANAALGRTLPFPTIIDNLALRAKVSATEFRAGIAAGSQPALSEANIRNKPKFAEAIPAELLARFEEQRNHGFVAADSVKSQPIIHLKNG